MNRMYLLHPGGWILDKQMNVIMKGAKIELVRMGIIPKQTCFEELLERLRNDKQI